MLRAKNSLVKRATMVNLYSKHLLALLTFFGCCWPALLVGDLRPAGGEVPVACDAVVTVIYYNNINTRISSKSNGG